MNGSQFHRDARGGRLRAGRERGLPRCSTLTALPDRGAGANAARPAGFTREAPACAARSNPTALAQPASVGDDYNRRGTCGLTGAARLAGRPARRGEPWRRPGKAQGVSATWNYGDSGIFYCFSTNAPPLEPERSYTAFGLLAALDYGGDFRAAAQALRQAGYGERR